MDSVMNIESIEKILSGDTRPIEQLSSIYTKTTKVLTGAEPSPEKATTQAKSAQ